MNKNIGIIVGIIAAVVIAGGAYAFMHTGDVEMTKEDNMVSDEGKGEAEDASMIKDNEEVMESKEEMNVDALMKTDEAGMDDMKKEATMGVYEAYSMEKLARAETGDVVLFFHAAWCPSCRGLGGDIEKNLSAIPEGVAILKVNYDTETELKKKYGVTYQHTLVQVDKDGNLIKKWSGSPSLAKLVSEIE